jgi:hypothetical protein
MCLLLTQSKSSPILSDAWLSDFYSFNGDGVGVMFAHHGELIIKKIIPNTAQEFIDFYRENIAGRDCAFHLRMRTHGDIDLLNCHPYEILNRSEHGLDLWLMHNGVLSTGNKADTTKSDTWHYIQNYLKPMLSGNPDFAFHPSFKALIEDHIGSSNKFVIMDNEGRQTVINEGSGVYWGGLWLSNTYAWSASKSAKNHPVNMKKAKKQVLEAPQKYSYKSSGFNYFGGYEDYSGSYLYPAKTWAYEKPADHRREVELNLEDLNYIIGEHDVSIDQGLNFVDEFGLESFLDLVDYAISGEIDLDWFKRVMTDYKLARESFPTLKRVIA